MAEWALGIILVLGVIFFIGLIKITYNIASGGVDMMEFFGSAGRPGTSRELGMNKMQDSKKEFKWGEDGKIN